MSITDSTVRKIEWVKHGVIAAGVTIEIKAGQTVLGSYTVPVGKKFDGTITVIGEVKNE